MEVEFPGDRRLRLLIGDITTIACDAIVNAANSQLQGGGGVDGAIHRAAGPELMQELAKVRNQHGPCAPGDAVVTGAGKLKAKWVFHAVGPIYRGGKHNEPELLASCYRRCLALADERAAHSIAFPAISTGVYGYPVPAASHIAMREIGTHLQRNPGAIQLALFVLASKEAYEIHAKALTALLDGGLQ